MDLSQDTFISSTFWTERVGFVAALSTIKKLTHHKVWEHLTNTGQHIGDKWKEISKKYDLNIEVTDFKPLITFKFQYGELNAALYTLFIQEMLKRKYIASNSIYLSYAHKDVEIQKYLCIIDEVFKYIKECINNNSVLDVLETKIKNEEFKRLN